MIVVALVYLLLGLLLGVPLLCVAGAVLFVARLVFMLVGSGNRAGQRTHYS